MNKNHWYDGWFYDKFIAPNQDGLFEQIGEIIEAGSAVIEVSCGTGTLAFTLGDKCDRILGLDMSRRSIEMAKAMLELLPNSRIAFRYMLLKDVLIQQPEGCDYAGATYVIHEVSEGIGMNEPLLSARS